MKIIIFLYSESSIIYALSDAIYEENAKNLIFVVGHGKCQTLGFAQGLLEFTGKFVCSHFPSRS